VEKEVTKSLASVEELKKYARKAKVIKVWTSWTETDGNYFKVEKKYFFSVLDYHFNQDVKVKYFHFDKEESTLFLD